MRATFSLGEGVVDRTVELTNRFIVDRDASGRPVGAEYLFVSRGVFTPIPVEAASIAGLVDLLIGAFAGRSGTASDVEADFRIGAVA